MLQRTGERTHTTALSRASATPLQRAVAAQAQAHPLLAVRLLSTAGSSSGAGAGKGKGKDKDKKLLHKKFEDAEDADATDIPAEVQFLAKELDADSTAEYDDDDFVADEVMPGEEVDVDDLDDELDDPALTPEEWAARFEREVAEWDADEDDEDGLEGEEGGEEGEVEDDRLYIEMPGYDASLSLAENGMLSSEGGGPDPFADWKQGTAYVY